MKGRVAVTVIAGMIAAVMSISSGAGMYPGPDQIPSEESRRAIIDELQARDGEFSIEVANFYHVYQDGKGCFVDNGIVGSLDSNSSRNCWTIAKSFREDEAELYYIGPDGYLLLNTTTPDGYSVNEGGARVIDGQVQKVYYRIMDMNEKDGANVCTEPVVRAEIRDMFGRPLEYVKNYYGTDRILQVDISNGSEIVTIDMGDGQSVAFVAQAASTYSDSWTRRNKIVGSVEGSVNCILNVDSVDASDEEVARAFGLKEMTYNSFMGIVLDLKIRTRELMISKVGPKVHAYIDVRMIY